MKRNGRACRTYLMDAAYFGNLAGAPTSSSIPHLLCARRMKSSMLSSRACKAAWTNLRQAGNRSPCAPRASEPAMLGSLADILEMAKPFRAWHPALDFAHLHARLGDGAMNTYASGSPPWISIANPWVRNPCSTCTSTFRHRLWPERRKEPPVMEEADLDFQELLRALHDSAPQGRLMWRKSGAGSGLPSSSNPLIESHGEEQ